MRNAVVALLIAATIGGGCVSAPSRSLDMIEDLAWLEAHGRTRDEVDLPKSVVLAALLDILPIPGVGHYYVGDIGDGIKTTLFFWLIVPWIMGPIDAAREARYQNDEAYLEDAHENGWFDARDAEPDEDDPPRERHRAVEREALLTDEPAREEPPPAREEPPASSTPTKGSRPTRAPAAPAAFCTGCGAAFKDRAERFCASCGAERRGS